MANWDYVLPYDERAAEYLFREGLPHPELVPRNRAPTLRELRSLDCAGVVFDVAQSDDEAVLETLRVRAQGYEAELRAVYALAAICGQQWIYPDSGAPEQRHREDREPSRLAWTVARAR